MPIALDLSEDAEATTLLLDAAQRFDSVDPVLARDTHLESLWAATLADPLGHGVVEAAKAASAAPPAAGAPRPTDVLVDGLALRFTAGYPTAAPLYGEWLRRENRRVDARRELRNAYEAFAGGGADAFAERASRELRVAGEIARKRTDHTHYHLTAQETQIARLAAQGLTNPEIGAQLFLSPRTVEWHLRKVYTKLSISSRRELRSAVPAS